MVDAVLADGCRWLMADAYSCEARPRPRPMPTESHASAGRPFTSVPHQRAGSNQHLISLIDLQCEPNESIG
jgi:hypothetical protein